MELTKPTGDITGPVIALDLGRLWIGVALSDPLNISIRRLDPIKRTSWKHLLPDILELTRRFDATSVVIGLPLRLDGTSGSAARDVERLATNFARSMTIPVFLQDERLTSVDAKANLQQEGRTAAEILRLVHSESAAIILRDFVVSAETRIPVSTELKEPGRTAQEGLKD